MDISADDAVVVGVDSSADGDGVVGHGATGGFLGKERFDAGMFDGFEDILF